MKEYRLKCDNEIWNKQFHNLLQDGMTPQQIDQGHNVWSRTKKGESRPKNGGKGDYYVECEEIAEATINNYHRYQSFIETITARKVPWTFRETGASSKSAEEIRLKSGAIIKMLKDALAEKGVKEGEDKYKYILSIGLAYAASYPKREWASYYAKRDPVFLDTFETRYKMTGHEKLNKYLRRNGGFGLTYIAGDDNQELTALEAIQKQKAMCTEYAKIHYALFKMAGLNPYFVVMTVQEVSEVWSDIFKQGKVKIAPDEEFTGHAVVALDIGDQPLYFDGPTELMYGVGRPYKGRGIKLSLREFLQVDILNHLGYLIKKQKTELAGRYIEIGLDLGKSLIQNRMYERKMNVSDSKEAARANAMKSLALHPESLYARYALARLDMQDGRFSEAEKSLMQLTEKIPSSFFQLARLHDAQNKNGMALAYFRKTIDVGLQVYSSELYLGRVYSALGEYEKANKHFDAAIKANQHETKARIGSARTTLRQKGLAEFIIPMEKALSNAVFSGDIQDIKDAAVPLLDAYLVLGDFDKANYLIDLVVSTLSDADKIGDKFKEIKDVKSSDIVFGKLQILGNDDPIVKKLMASAYGSSSQASKAVEQFKGIYGSSLCEEVNDFAVVSYKIFLNKLGNKALLAEFMDSCYSKKSVQMIEFLGRIMFPESFDRHLHFLVYKIIAEWEAGKKAEALKSVNLLEQRVKEGYDKGLKEYFELYSSTTDLPDELLKIKSEVFEKMYLMIAAKFVKEGDYAAGLYLYNNAPLLRDKKAKYRKIINKLEKELKERGVSL